MQNEFSNQASILAELWMNYRDSKDMEDFMQYNDLGLPMAYFVHNELVEPKVAAKMLVTETYELLLAALGVDDDEYTSLDELLSAAEDLED